MAARATRSASSGGSPRHLLELSHDALGVIVDGLADPLQPVVAVALSSTCLGLRTPLQVALEVLKGRHERAVALCRLPGRGSCVGMRDATALNFSVEGLIADDMATLGMILRTNGLPCLQNLWLQHNAFGDRGMQALCEGLGCGTAPSLRCLDLTGNQFGPAGAEALAAALRGGAMPKLEELDLSGLSEELEHELQIGNNPIGNQGVAALGAPLRMLPALKVLELSNCNIGDEGVASLVADLGKDDFKALKKLWLDDNKITDAGAAKLVATIDAGGLPKLVDHDYFLKNNAATAAALQGVSLALDKRSQ